MAISFDTSTVTRRSMPVESRGILHYLVFSPAIEITALYLYYVRDCFAGVIRYGLDIAHAGGLWFFPDLMAFVCVGLFVFRYIYVARNVIASFLVVWFLFSFLMAYFFFKNGFAVASGIKMIAPVFVGFCFCMRPVNEMKSIRYLFYFVFLSSCIGIFWNSFGSMAWEGYAYEGLGAGERVATKVWWANGTARLGGFAADSTMASFFVMAGFVVLAINSKFIVRISLAVFATYFSYISTNKTTLVSILLIFFLLSLGWILGKKKETRLLQVIARYSYLTIFIPYLLIIILNGVDLSSINPIFFSMQDRINNSWVLPVVYMADLFPPGFVTGCGAGCFNYPMKIFQTAVQDYYVPVDNFYYGTYLMFGIPFLLFLIRHCVTQRPTDPLIIITTIAMNVFGITVLCYGPASSLLLFGIIYSGNFSSKPWLKHIDDYHGKRTSPPKNRISVGRFANTVP